MSDQRQPSPEAQALYNRIMGRGPGLFTQVMEKRDREQAAQAEQAAQSANITSSQVYAHMTGQDNPNPFDVMRGQQATPEPEPDNTADMLAQLDALQAKLDKLK